MRESTKIYTPTAGTTTITPPPGPPVIIVSKGPTSNPGASAAGIDGCISNCGTSIVNNDDTPDEFFRVAYYDSWNWDRDCLRQRAEWFNMDSYSHMHWAFGTVDENLSVYVDDSFSQWEGFISLDNVKKIVSFGGWGFSTNVSTYEILRSAMTPDTRDAFVQNVVQFVSSTGINGIDIDWEVRLQGCYIDTVTRRGVACYPLFLQFLLTRRPKDPLEPVSLVPHLFRLRKLTWYLLGR